MENNKERKSRDYRLLVLRMTGLFMLVPVFYLLLIPLGAQVEAAGSLLAQRAGGWGVFLYTFIVDALILPASVDLVLPFILRWDAVPVLAAMSAASVLGGCVGYFIGFKLNYLGIVQRLTRRYRQRGEYLISRYGFWAVVLAAVSPVPFSTVSWIAGMMKQPFHLYAAGALFRVPRIIAAYLLLYITFQHLPA